MAKIIPASLHYLAGCRALFCGGAAEALAQRRQDFIMEQPPAGQDSGISLEFSGEIWYWRGPSPYHFVTIPEAQSGEIKAIARLVTYGWGVIPVAARIGNTRFTTSLFPRNGLYVLPVKDRVREAEGIAEGDHITARIEVRVRRGES